MRENTDASNDLKNTYITDFLEENTIMQFLPSLVPALPFPQYCKTTRLNCAKFRIKWKEYTVAKKVYYQLTDKIRKEPQNPLKSYMLQGSI